MVGHRHGPSALLNGGNVSSAIAPQFCITKGGADASDRLSLNASGRGRTSRHRRAMLPIVRFYTGPVCQFGNHQFIIWNRKLASQFAIEGMNLHGGNA